MLRCFHLQQVELRPAPQGPPAAEYGLHPSPIGTSSPAGRQGVLRSLSRKLTGTDCQTRETTYQEQHIFLTMSCKVPLGNLCV